LVVLFLFSACSAFAENKQRDKRTAIVSHIPRERVESSAIATVGYSKKLHALEIEFLNGAIYRYLEVPGSVYRDLLGAESKARFYDKNVRRKYRSMRVRPRKEQ
jgi:hypothetical protein